MNAFVFLGKNGEFSQQNNILLIFCLAISHMVTNIVQLY